MTWDVGVRIFETMESIKGRMMVGSEKGGEVEDDEARATTESFQLGRMKERKKVWSLGRKLGREMESVMRRKEAAERAGRKLWAERVMEML